MVQHNVGHVDVRERMTTSKTGRIMYVLAWVPWAGRSVTTNDNSTNMHGDSTIHSYKNAISGISAPFYCNIVSSWMKKIVESQSTILSHVID